MRRFAPVAVAVALLALADSAASEPMTLTDAVHRLVVTGLPATAKSADIWFWLPNDDAFQKVTDLGVAKTPGPASVLGPSNGRYLHVRADLNSKPAEVVVETRFSLTRDIQPPAVALAAPAASGPYARGYELAFADSLRPDAPNMAVTPAVRDLAARICGAEADPSRQMAMLFRYAATETRHSKNPTLTKPIKSSVDDATNAFLTTPTAGSAEHCLANGGGGCADQHALLVALARSKAIPTRFVFGSRVTGPVGRDHKPGYHCWLEFFRPGSGWLPVDVSCAGNEPEVAAKYFTGLDARRIRYNEGRDFRLSYPDGTQTPAIPLFIGAYVLVDGKVHTSWSRSLNYR